MTDGEIFNADPGRYLIVDDPINNCRYQAEQNDQEELHLRLHRNRRLYPRVRIIILELEILVLEIVDALYGWIEPDLRERPRLTGELQPRLLEVVCVEMQIPKGVDERPGFEIAHLGDHHRIILELEIPKGVDERPGFEIAHLG